MTYDRRDPEYPQYADQRIANAVAAFEAGGTTEPVFRARIYAAGKRGRDIEDMVRLHRLARPLCAIVAGVLVRL